MFHVGRVVDQGPEERPGRVETVMEGFQENWSLRLRQFGQLEEDLGLLGIGYGWFLEKNVLARADGADRPFEVQSIGKWDEYAVDIRVVEDF